eukprot:3545714-Prymnesium_polylepis.1
MARTIQPWQQQQRAAARVVGGAQCGAAHNEAIKDGVGRRPPLGRTVFRQLAAVEGGRPHDVFECRAA